MSNTVYYRDSHTPPAGGASLTDTVVNAMDSMVRWPIRMTGATMDYMRQGVERITGMTNGDQEHPRTPWFDQDLSGDDLKYVVWSIVYTKPGHECILHKQQEELVSYSADPNVYAAGKIARFMDGARHGHIEKPEGWHEVEFKAETKETKETVEKSWRIAGDDHKYVAFLYRVDRRIPRHHEMQRMERVTTIERTARTM